MLQLYPRSHEKHNLLLRKKEPAHEFAKTLNKHGPEYRNPHSITEYEEKYKKIGRNKG